MDAKGREGENIEEEDRESKNIERKDIKKKDGERKGNTYHTNNNVADRGEVLLFYIPKVKPYYS